MARIRTVKPDFFHHEDLAACTPHARLLAIAILQLADKEGRFRWLAPQVHAHAFPFEPAVKVDQLAEELADAGFLYLYDVDGKTYACIPTFTAHQRISGKESETESRCPSPDTEGSIRVLPRVLPQNNSSASPVVLGKEEVGSRKEEVGSGKGKREKDPTAAAVKVVVDHYCEIHPRSRPAEKERKLIRARLAEGYSVEDLKAAIDGCHKSPFHCGDNEQGKKHQSLELIVRDSKHVTDFMETNEARAGPPLSRRTQKTITAAEAFIENGHGKQGNDSESSNHLGGLLQQGS